MDLKDIKIEDIIEEPNQDLAITMAIALITQLQTEVEELKVVLSAYEDELC